MGEGYFVGLDNHPNYILDYYEEIVNFYRSHARAAAQITNGMNFDSPFFVPSLAVRAFSLAAANAGGRVFWSGQSAVAGKAAENFARANSMKTLEMTWQGKALANLTNATSHKFTEPLWNRASASFAKGAKGPVNVFHNASSGVRLNSVWRGIEYPILNGKNNIIYHNVFK